MAYNVILFDDDVRNHLLPFTFIRPVSELRVGILTIREKWERWLGQEISYITQDYLAEKYSIDYGRENYIINGSVLPSDPLVTLLQQMEFNEAFLQGDELIAAKLDDRHFERLINDEDFGELRGFDLEDTPYLKINNLWDIYLLNGAALELDFQLMTMGRQSLPISPTNQVIGADRIFLEEGARVECSVLNASAGPIYIGRDAEIMEGCLIRGGLGMGNNAILKMGARIYGPTTLGPFSKVGGEVKNSVIMAYSNKSHDGYLGNSVIGEWCNIGADTNASNLKNTYADVSIWNYAKEDFSSTGEQFCGLFMGDHSRCGINTMFNTGTVIGVGANVFGGGFPVRFIPSFSWGGAHGLETYRPDKALDSIDHMMQRLGYHLDVSERLILLRVFEETARYRVWEY